jgi:hypothetical protein
MTSLLVCLVSTLDYHLVDARKRQKISTGDTAHPVLVPAFTTTTMAGVPEGISFGLPAIAFPPYQVDTKGGMSVQFFNTILETPVSIPQIVQMDENFFLYIL